MDAIKDLTGCNSAERRRSHFAIATIAAVAVLTTANNQSDRGEEETAAAAATKRSAEREPYLMGEEWRACFWIDQDRG